MSGLAFPSAGPLDLGSLPSQPFRLSVLCSAKTASCPSQVSLLVARFPLPYSLSVFVRLCAKAHTDAWGFCSSGCPLPFRGTIWRHAALPSYRVIPLYACPALRPRGCPAACLLTDRTAAFRSIKSVGFPSCFVGSYPCDHDLIISGFNSTACILAAPSSIPPPLENACGFASDLPARLCSDGT